MPVLGVADGKWLLGGPMKPMAKPGGHGAIWKLMRDEGVFEWLKGQVRLRGDLDFRCRSVCAVCFTLG